MPTFDNEDALFRAVNSIVPGGGWFDWPKLVVDRSEEEIHARATPCDARFPNFAPACISPSPY